MATFTKKMSNNLRLEICGICEWISWEGDTYMTNSCWELRSCWWPKCHVRNSLLRTHKDTISRQTWNKSNWKPALLFYVLPANIHTPPPPPAPPLVQVAADTTVLASYHFDTIALLKALNLQLQASWALKAIISWNLKELIASFNFVPFM